MDGNKVIIAVRVCNSCEDEQPDPFVLREEDESWSHFNALIMSLFKSPPSSISVKYLDDENDWVDMGSDAELAEAIKMAKAFGEILQIQVLPSGTNSYKLASRRSATPTDPDETVKFLTYSETQTPGPKTPPQSPAEGFQHAPLVYPKPVTQTFEAFVQPSNNGTNIPVLQPLVYPQPYTQSPQYSVPTGTVVYAEREVPSAPVNVPEVRNQVDSTWESSSGYMHSTLDTAPGYTQNSTQDAATVKEMLDVLKQLNRADDSKVESPNSSSKTDAENACQGNGEVSSSTKALLDEFLPEDNGRQLSPQGQDPFDISTYHVLDQPEQASDRDHSPTLTPTPASKVKQNARRQQGVFKFAGLSDITGKPAAKQPLPATRSRPRVEKQIRPVADVTTAPHVKVAHPAPQCLCGRGVSQAQVRVAPGTVTPVGTLRMMEGAQSGANAVAIEMPADMEAVRSDGVAAANGGAASEETGEHVGREGEAAAVSSQEKPAGLEECGAGAVISLERSPLPIVEVKVNSSPADVSKKTKEKKTHKKCKGDKAEKKKSSSGGDKKKREEKEKRKERKQEEESSMKVSEDVESGEKVGVKGDAALQYNDFVKHMKKVKKELVASIVYDVARHTDQIVHRAHLYSLSQHQRGILQIHDDVIHHGIYCDNCNATITGVRYKCGNCHDYDLCEACECIPDLHDSTHVFLKLRRPVRNAGYCSSGRLVPLLSSNVYETTAGSPVDRIAQGLCSSQPGVGTKDEAHIQVTKPTVSKQKPATLGEFEFIRPATCRAREIQETLLRDRQIYRDQFLGSTENVGMPHAFDLTMARGIDSGMSKIGQVAEERLIPHTATVTVPALCSSSLSHMSHRREENHLPNGIKSSTSSSSIVQVSIPAEDMTECRSSEVSLPNVNVESMASTPSPPEEVNAPEVKIETAEAEANPDPVPGIDSLMTLMAASLSEQQAGADVASSSAMTDQDKLMEILAASFPNFASMVPLKPQKAHISAATELDCTATLPLTSLSDSTPMVPLTVAAAPVSTPMVPLTAVTAPDSTPLTAATAPDSTPMVPVTVATSPDSIPMVRLTAATAPDSTPMVPLTTATVPDSISMIPLTPATAPDSTPMVPLTEATAPDSIPMIPLTTAIPIDLPTIPLTLDNFSETPNVALPAYNVPDTSVKVPLASSDAPESEPVDLACHSLKTEEAPGELATTKSEADECEAFNVSTCDYCSSDSDSSFQEMWDSDSSEDFCIIDPECTLLRPEEFQLLPDSTTLVAALGMSGDQSGSVAKDDNTPVPTYQEVMASAHADVTNDTDVRVSPERKIVMVQESQVPPTLEAQELASPAEEEQIRTSLEMEGRELEMEDEVQSTVRANASSSDVNNEIASEPNADEETLEETCVLEVVQVSEVEEPSVEEVDAAVLTTEAVVDDDNDGAVLQDETSEVASGVGLGLLHQISEEEMSRLVELLRSELGQELVLESKRVEAELRNRQLEMNGGQTPSLQKTVAPSTQATGSRQERQQQEADLSRSSRSRNSSTSCSVASSTTRDIDCQTVSSVEGSTSSPLANQLIQNVATGVSKAFLTAKDVFLALQAQGTAAASKSAQSSAKSGARPKTKCYTPPQNTYKPPENNYKPPQSTYKPPESNYKVPESTYKLPEDTFEMPANTYEPKESNFQLPEENYQPPKSTFKLPEDSFKLPEDNYKPPESTYRLPEDSYMPPQSTYRLPEDTYKPPRNTYIPPQSNYKPPEDTYVPKLVTFKPPEGNARDYDDYSGHDATHGESNWTAPRDAFIPEWLVPQPREQESQNEEQQVGVSSADPPAVVSLDDVPLTPEQRQKEEAMQRLKEMGFTNLSAIDGLLAKHKNDLERVLQVLLEEGQ